MKTTRLVTAAALVIRKQLGAWKPLVVLAQVSAR
jgi:hypothetical protein